MDWFDLFTFYGVAGGLVYLLTFSLFLYHSWQLRALGAGRVRTWAGAARCAPSITKAASATWGFPLNPAIPKFCFMVCTQVLLPCLLYAKIRLADSAACHSVCRLIPVFHPGDSSMKSLIAAALLLTCAGPALAGGTGTGKLRCSYSVSAIIPRLKNQSGPSVFCNTGKSPLITF